MSVHGCINPVMNDSEEDDDAPIVFRRANSSSKQGHLSSTSKKTDTQKDASSNLVSNQIIRNGESSHSQNVKLLPKASSEKPPLARSNVGSLQRESHNKLIANDGNPKPEDGLSDSDDDKPLSHRLNSTSAAVQKKNSMEAEKICLHSTEDNFTSGSAGKMDLSKSNIKSENSDDDKPLSLKYSSPGAVNRIASLQVVKASQSTKPTLPPSVKLNSKTKEASDDSEDEKPLLSRFQSKAVGGSTMKDSNGAEKSYSKSKLNGSDKKDTSSDVNSAKGGQKRPLSGANPADSSSIKKSKLSDSSVSVKVKQVVKKENQTDDNDHLPIAQRMKKPVSSNSASISKNALLKTTSSSLKKSNIKTKKKMKDSKFSKSLPPGSGGGQKWITLEHNGVIFPPPYKPHGVKMLYKGEPVGLTPEQEEVATMFAVMKDTDFASKKQFIENFMHDWRLILGKNHIIKKFELCDFTPIYEWHLNEKEKKKQMTSEIG